MKAKNSGESRFATNEAGVIKAPKKAEQPNGTKISGNDLRARGGKKKGGE